MFIDNKYTEIYYKIINRGITRNHQKIKNDNFQKHHIIPKCLGGTNDKKNLVYLTYKEHRVCHCLLIKMQHNFSDEILMRHAYGFFNKNSRFNGPGYKRGKDNIFSSPEIIELVKQRMITNNPMKDPEIQQRRLESWAAARRAKTNILPRILKDKFITPYGIFKTKKEIQQQLNIPAWTLNAIYNNLDGYPTASGRASKKISHLNIDPNKTWRENGFSIL